MLFMIHLYMREIADVIADLRLPGCISCEWHLWNRPLLLANFT